MRRPGPRSQSRGMNANTMNPEAPTTEPTDSRPEPRPGFDPERTALRRPFEDRMLAGRAPGPAPYLRGATPILPGPFLVLAILGGPGPRADLNGLFDDLPETGAPAATDPSAGQLRRRRRHPVLLAALIVFVAIAAAHVVWPLLWIGFLVAIVLFATGTIGHARSGQRR